MGARVQSMHSPLKENMPNKIKRTQKENLKEAHGRDMFQTPNYATELLIPFIPKNVTCIWECAAGERKISNILLKKGYHVTSSDINGHMNLNVTMENFLTATMNVVANNKNSYAIITNPPYSLKRKFYFRCLEYEVPFALLIPADYSGWVIDALQNGAEKIIPTRRIDFITPTGKSGATGHSANYHSLWLTHGFNLGKTETFVELTKEMKENI